MTNYIVNTYTSNHNSATSRNIMIKNRHLLTTLKGSYLLVADINQEGCGPLGDDIKLTGGGRPLGSDHLEGDAA